MQCSQLIWCLILNNIGHPPYCQRPAVVFVDTDLIWSELVKVWLGLGWRVWQQQLSCKPLHDFLADVAYGIWMVFKDNAVADVELVPHPVLSPKAVDN